jgi:hypothetical protein
MAIVEFDSQPGKSSEQQCMMSWHGVFNPRPMRPNPDPSGSDAPGTG